MTDLEDCIFLFCKWNTRKQLPLIPLNVCHFLNQNPWKPHGVMLGWRGHLWRCRDLARDNMKSPLRRIYWEKGTFLSGPTEINPAQTQAEKKQTKYLVESCMLSGARHDAFIWPGRSHLMRKLSLGRFTLWSAQLPSGKGSIWTQACNMLQSSPSTNLIKSLLIPRRAEKRFCVCPLLCLGGPW